MEKNSGRRKKTINSFIRKILALPDGFAFNFLSQRFDKETENEFSKKYFQDSIIYIRAALLLSIIFYGLFSILDHILAPGLFSEFFLIRFSIVIPLMLSVFLFSFYPAFRKYYQFLMNIIFLSAGAGMILMVYIAENSGYILISRLYSIALVLIFFFGYVLLKLRYTWASISGWTLFIITGIVLTIPLDLQPNHRTSIIFFLFTANFFGMVASYLYELNLRKHFFAQNQLDNERKKVQRMNLELEKKVILRTRDLEDAKCKAEESEKLKTAFLANMSHEIRTPMNGILGFTEILANEEIDEQKKKKYLKIINGRAQFLMDLINKIIDISLIESNQLKFNYEQIELNSFMDKLHKTYRVLFEESNVAFTLDLERKEEMIVIESDRGKLEHIISNFLANASKFTSRGHVVLGYKFLKDKLRIYVKDTGPGIPEAQREYIFYRFTKYEKDQEEYKSGTGLGLSISKGLAKFLDGETGFISREGEGSVFYIDFLLIEIMQLEEEI